MIMKYENIIEIKGKVPGPTSIIMGGVHGNEIAGVKTVENLIENLTIESGKVYLAFGNPHAIKQNIRMTEKNLNRMFKPIEELSVGETNSYEYKRAELLKTFLDQSSALLDLHNSSNPESQPFIICESNSKAITEYFPIQKIVSGFDDIEPGGTDYYMNKTGKIGICVECGFHGDPISNEIALKAAYIFLTVRGHIKGEYTKNEHDYYRLYGLHVTKTSRFKVVKKFPDFTNIDKGELIAYDGDEEIRSPDKSIILFARDRDSIGEEAFLLGKKIAST